jgi:hypothetical protein
MSSQDLGNSEETFEQLTYYSNYRAALEVNDVKGRLIRFCQNYKSDYFLHNKRSSESLYRTLITVDDQN